MFWLVGITNTRLRQIRIYQHEKVGENRGKFYSSPTVCQRVCLLLLCRSHTATWVCQHELANFSLACEGRFKLPGTSFDPQGTILCDGGVRNDASRSNNDRVMWIISFVTLFLVSMFSFSFFLLLLLFFFFLRLSYFRLDANVLHFFSGRNTARKLPLILRFFPLSFYLWFLGFLIVINSITWKYSNMQNDLV